MTSEALRWLLHRSAAGLVHVRVGRAGDEVVAEWVGYATLRASLSSTWSQFTPADGVEPDMALHALRPAVDAFLRSLQGGITLHASCVAYGGVAVAFLGDSMAGKSTMGALLCRDPEIELVSDDMVALAVEAERVQVLPGEPEHALRPEAARALGLTAGPNAKVTFPAARRTVDAIPLGALVSLVFDPSAEAPITRRVRGAEAFIALSTAATRFVFDEPEFLRRELNTFGQIADRVPSFELRRALDSDNMDASAREAMRLLSSLSAPSPP